MDVARQIEAGDAYIDLDRKDAKAQWAKIKADNPCTTVFVCQFRIGTNLY